MKKILVLLSFLIVNGANLKAAQGFGLVQDDYRKTESESKLATDKDEKEHQEIDSLIGQYPKTAKLIRSTVNQLPDDCQRQIFRLCQSHLYKCHKIIRHQSYFTKMIKLKNGNLAVCSTKGEIQIWRHNINNNSRKCIHTIKAHEGWIQSIVELNNGNIASCSTDETIKLWEYNKKDNSWECIHILNGHNNFVNSIIELSNGNLASCSNDGTIKIWQFQKTTENNFWKCIDTLVDVFRPQSIIQLRNGNIASFSYDETIKIWEYNQENNTWICKNIVTNHAHRISSIIKLSDGNIATSSWDGTIKIWKHKKSEDSWECIHTFVHFNYVSSIIELRNGNIASCADDGIIKIWKFDRENNLWENIDNLKHDCVRSIIELSNGDFASYSLAFLKIWRKPYPIKSEPKPALKHIESGIQRLHNGIKNNPYAAFATMLLMIKYRNQISKLFRK